MAGPSRYLHIHEFRVFGLLWRIIKMHLIPFLKFGAKLLLFRGLRKEITACSVYIKMRLLLWSFHYNIVEEEELSFKQSFQVK